MRKPIILIADDDTLYCQLTSSIIMKSGYQVFVAKDLESCTKILDSEKIDIVFQDLAFPAIRDGFEALEYAHEKHPEVAVVIVSGEGHIPDAVRALKSGAIDYIEKPDQQDMMLAKIAACENLICLEEQNKELAVKAMGMVGKSQSMQVVYESIVKAAQYDTPVLITGETGVGKELVAKAIHKLSKYSDKNLVSVNCGAIPNDLIASELFGHEQGAFTGAVKAKRGFFETADGGSIFLNEIGELPSGVQATLLRVLSEGEVQKLGGKIVRVKTRVICDTNINIEEHIEKEMFRKDLYYRISTITIPVPPLRNRIEDIPDLANHFMSNFCASNNLIPKPLSASAIAWLMQQPWKGNIRELKSIIERGVINAKNDHIAVVDLHPSETEEENALSFNPKSLRNSLMEFEKTLIVNALIQCNWNKTQAANLLELDKSNLMKKVKYYDIQRD